MNDIDFLNVFWVVVFVQAFSCGVFCSFVADEKNRDAPSWFFLGLFFGLIALIAIAGCPSLLNKPGASSTAKGYRSKDPELDRELDRILLED